MKNYRRAVFSICLIFVALTAQADWTSMQTSFQKSKTRGEAISYLKGSEKSQDEELVALIDDFESANTKEGAFTPARAGTQIYQPNAAGPKAPKASPKRGK